MLRRRAIGTSTSTKQRQLLVLLLRHLLKPMLLTSPAHDHYKARHHRSTPPVVLPVHFPWLLLDLFLPPCSNHSRNPPPNPSEPPSSSSVVSRTQSAPRQTLDQTNTHSNTPQLEPSHASLASKRASDGGRGRWTGERREGVRERWREGESDGACGAEEQKTA